MLLDTYAWIEFFIKSDKGKKVKRLLEKQRCFTSILSFAEITEWASKQKLNPKEFLKIVSELSEIIKLDFEIAVLAGKLNFERKKTVKNWGMLDSLILATSLVYKLKVVTGDLHFKDLPDAEIL